MKKEQLSSVICSYKVQTVDSHKLKDLLQLSHFPVYLCRRGNLTTQGDLSFRGWTDLFEFLLHVFMCMCVFGCVSDPAIIWKEEQWHSCTLGSRWLWKPNPKASLAGIQSARNVECCCLPPETWARKGLLFQASSKQ